MEQLGATTVYQERLRPTGRAWNWFAVIVGISWFTGGWVLVLLGTLAWTINVVRFWKSELRIDHERVYFGKRSVKLAALDPATLGRASNPWPWRSFSSRYLGGNPIWTRDSVGVRGVDSGRKFWLSVGTNRRDELVAVLEAGMAQARARAEAAATAYAGMKLPPPGWFDDPWDPTGHHRWWDGTEWTGYTAPKTAPGP